jgi:hypothetical protein
MNGPSLEYYTAILRNNPEKISSVKQLLRKDFEAMEIKMRDAVQKNDIPQIRREFHRMRPIIWNLRFTRMMDLLDKYQNRETIDIEFSDDLATCFEEIFCLLRTDDTID